MKNVQTAKDIDSLPLEEQLSFYRSYFQGLHCELDGCGAEVNDDWVIYKGELYCQHCFDWKYNDDKEKAIISMENMKKQIKGLQEEYGIE